MCKRDDLSQINLLYVGFEKALFLKLVYMVGEIHESLLDPYLSYRT